MGEVCGLLNALLVIYFIHLIMGPLAHWPCTTDSVCVVHWPTGHAPQTLWYIHLWAHGLCITYKTHQVYTNKYGTLHFFTNDTGPN